HIFNTFYLFRYRLSPNLHLHPSPTRRSSDLPRSAIGSEGGSAPRRSAKHRACCDRTTSSRGSRSSSMSLPSTQRHARRSRSPARSEEHTSELQSLAYFVCRLLLVKKQTR